MKSQIVLFFVSLTGFVATPSRALDFDRSAGFPIRSGEHIILMQKNEPLPPGDERRLEKVEQTLTIVDAASRREFSGTGDQIEFTFEYRLPTSEKSFSYELEIPLVRGSKIEVTHGSYLENKQTEWIVDDRISHIDEARFLSVEGPEQSFSIDCDPMGAWQTVTDYDKSFRTCRLEKNDQGLRLRFVRGGNRYGGGRIRGKLIVYPQAIKFEQIHPFHRSGYKLPLAYQYALAFTSGRAPKGFETAGLQAYEKTYGWTNKPNDVTIVKRGGEAAVHREFVSGSQSSAFRIDAVPGWHFVTLAIGDREQAVGPMQVKINGKVCVEDLVLDANRFAGPHFAVETADGRIEIELSGSRWVLNGLFVQPIMTNQEDFKLRRNWWNRAMEWPE